MLLDLLKTRYSCRNFSSKLIPKEVISYILECGRLSASGGNAQPWKFGVITDAVVIKKLSQSAGINYKQDWIATAPLIIVLCTQLYNCPDPREFYEKYNGVGLNRFPGKKNKILEMDPDLYTIINMEEHQTKIPGEHMVLAALEHGIYSTWISSMDCEMAGEIIGIEGYLVSNLIAFGYPEGDRYVRPKKELKDITFTNHFTNDGF